MSEKLVRVKYGYLPHYDLIPTQQHQIVDELLQIEKEFASLIYFQKDLERKNY